MDREAALRLAAPLGGGMSRTDGPCGAATGAILAEVPASTSEDLDAAVESAKQAQIEWANSPLKDRVQVMFRMKTLIEEKAQQSGSVNEQALWETYKDFLDPMINTSLQAPPQNVLQFPDRLESGETGC